MSNGRSDGALARAVVSSLTRGAAPRPTRETEGATEREADDTAVAAPRACPRRRFRALDALIPRSLAARTALILLIGLGVVQGIGLVIHAHDAMLARRVLGERYVGIHVMNAYRSMLDAPPDARAAEAQHLVSSMHLLRAGFDPAPNLGDLPPEPPGRQHFIRLNLDMVPMPRERRPLAVRAAGGHGGPLALALLLPDGSGWFNLEVPPPHYSFFDDPTFLIAWAVMTLSAAALVIWATRRLVAPIATLAAAADKLGRDVNAAPMPEGGAQELALASAAFNTMAGRIRRFVQDRTFLLTAIGHDLRTPITRLKLRSEFIEDDDLRRRFLADLDELEAMVAATLAFGRDSAAGSEPAVRMDLAALLRTVLDDAADADPAHAERIAFTAEGPRSVPIQARPMALKRTFQNLVGNALAYAGNVTVTLTAPHEREVRVLVEDDGPGIPASETERVFEPFRRLETSRSRETGGTGLGLSIARNIVRGHGGEITLSNRPTGGLRALVVLPL